MPRSSATHGPQRAGALLAAHDLRMAFGGVQALDGMSFEVAQGAAVGLLGQNGSGKTTLVNVLTGQLRPQAGIVRFKGEEMIGRRPEEFSKAGIGRVFQSVQVFPRLTLLENLAAVQVGRGGHAGHDEESARQILARIGLSTYENEWAQDLSYGEQRLLEIGMAVAAGSQLIFLDEPTAGLNPMMLDRVVELLREVNQSGVSLVVIEHQTDVVFGLCELVWVMDQGQLLAKGSPQEIQGDERVLESYLAGTQ
jgi:ABC-type branched-subunit amino acid transport system ATPase component